MADIRGLLDLTDEDKSGALNMGLLQAGLGILANNTNRSNPMPAIGQGGLMGLQGYQQAMDRAQKQKLLAIEKAKMVRAEETYQRQQEALKTAPPEIQRAVALGASIEDFYKPQKLGEGESLTVPALSIGAAQPAGLGMLAPSGLPAGVLAQGPNKPMVEKEYPVGGNQVQPHISFDRGQSWKPIPGSKPQDKFAPAKDDRIENLIAARQSSPAPVQA